MKQLYAELRLKRANGLRERWLGDVEASRRRGDAAFVHHREEIAQSSFIHR